ncbi:MAG: hypothetical protein K0R51_3340 [Cytophagaceae bacterium]|jgi:hypothetical protein|nr:hypothetical protein [Cytophagaceae bacterium]
MLKILHLFILLFALSLVSPVIAQDETFVIDSLETEDADYLPSEEFPELVEQTQPIYKKDTVDGKSLDSTTWRNLTKDLTYGDTLEHKKKPDTKTKPKEESKTRSFPSFGFGSAMTKYILFALVIAAIVFLLYRLIGSAFLSGNTKITKSQATFEILHDDEQMMQKDLNSLLEEALQRKDYKTAIRILFIQSLQDLQTYEWIKWKKEKTNRDYLNELMQRDAFVPFGSMVLLYEKAWYSESGATQEDWEAFSTFRQQIKSI